MARKTVAPYDPDRFVWVSATMVPNIFWVIEWFCGGAPRSPRYVREGKGMTYRCREGQLRGKAAKKAFRRLSRDPA